MQDLQARLQHLSQILAQAYMRARLLWQHVVASWPAWTASLKYDVEYVVEYAIGVLPAWLATVRAALRAAYDDVRATAAMQQLASSVSTAAKDMSVNIRRLQQAVADTNQLASNRLAESPPLQQLVRLASNLASRESSGAATNVARGLTHSMAALTAAELAVNAPVSSASDCGNARSSPVFAWGRNETAAIAEVAGPPSRRSSNDPSIDGRLQMVGWLPSDLHATMYSVGAAGSSSLQHMVMEPLQQAGFISSCGRGPTLAGVIAAASVVLAGSVYRSMQHQAQETEERLLQQVQLQMKAENLAAQRARFRRALDDSQAQSAGTGAVGPSVSISTRRRAPSPPDGDAWEDTLSASPLLPAAGANSRSGRQAAVPQLDAAAAREYQRFMAGARAMDVPMWDSHMVEDLPKVSMKEMQRQTQKIRSAATDQERADMEDAEKRREMVEQQLNSQLADLAGAPLGRAAREAWRREQQEMKQQQEQQRLAEQQAGGRSRGGSPASSAGGDAGDFNPFAVSGDARAKWDAEDHLYSEPAPRKGGGFGGFGGFGGRQQQQQQPQQSQQPQARRRKFADEPVDNGVLQPAASSSSPGASSSSGRAANLSGQPAGQRQQQQQQPPAAAQDGPAEGSPEWEAQARAEMLKNAAARRARRQQMVQQQPAVQSSTSAPQVAVPSGSQPQQSRGTGGVVAAAAGAVASRSIPNNSSLHRPKWPGADTIAAVAAVAGAAANADAAAEPAATSNAGSGVSAVRMQNELAAAAAAGGSRLAAAAAKDVHEVIPAAVPSSGSMQRLQDSAPPAMTAAAAVDGAGQVRPSSRSSSRSSSRQEAEDDEVNPFAVDRAAIIDDETAYEIGKVVDEETKRIRLL
uniref:Uncharacterized protein n=1 Tax=Tetradesmus obliquus TaxID=3088 RepID=A0A383V5T0_TETOB|eukprot:jgi/Sobl393_1/291/SZX60079.1